MLGLATFAFMTCATLCELRCKLEPRPADDRKAAWPHAISDYGQVRALGGRSAPEGGGANRRRALCRIGRPEDGRGSPTAPRSGSSIRWIRGPRHCRDTLKKARYTVRG